MHGARQMSSAHVSPTTQGKLPEHMTSCGSSHTPPPGAGRQVAPIQSFDVAHCAWHVPNAQISVPLQSLLIEHPFATPVGGGVLLQLAAATRAPSAKRKLRTHTGRGFLVRVERRFEFMVTTPGPGSRFASKEHGACGIARACDAAFDRETREKRSLLHGVETPHARSRGKLGAVLWETL